MNAPLAAELFHQEAERIRRLAEVARSAALRQKLFGIAQEYETMATPAEMLARESTEPATAA
jgi:hypothetical protein